jgi:hypothetical protein
LQLILRTYKWHSLLMLLCLLYLLAGQSESVSAQFSGEGSGTEQEPYLISTAEQLREINDSNEGQPTEKVHYKLVNDIDLGVAPYNEGEGWEPLNYFFGTLDGSGYAIRNMKISNPTIEQQGQTSPRNEVGLFSRLGEGAYIHNLAILDVDIQADSLVGAVAGLSYEGDMQGITVTGSIRGNYGIGGVLGLNHGGAISNVVFYGDVQGNLNGTSGSASSANVGSIVGSNNDYGDSPGIVEYAYAFGTVQAQSHFGGIVGYNNGTVNEVYAMHKQVLHNPGMMSSGDFGRIVGWTGENASGEGLYASPITQPPAGYQFGDVDYRLDGELLTSGAESGGNGMGMPMEIVNDNNLLNDVMINLFAHFILIAAEPVFELGDSYDSVTQNIELPEIGAVDGLGEVVEGLAEVFTLNWTSSDPSIVDNTGIVNRPVGNENANVQLTSTVTASVYSGGTGGTINYSRTYELTVLHEYGEEEYDYEEIRNHLLQVLEINNPGELLSIQHIVQYMMRADVYYTGNDELSAEDIRRLLNLVPSIYS